MKLISKAAVVPLAPGLAGNGRERYAILTLELEIKSM